MSKTSDFLREYGKDLRHFLYRALLYFYSDEGRAGQDGTIDEYINEFGEGEWSATLVHLGAQPFSEMLVVRYKGVACFVLHCYQKRVTAPLDWFPVQNCLGEALRSCSTIHPWRGPKRMQSSNGLYYRNRWSGDVASVSGVEEVRDAANRTMYAVEYTGGVIGLK